MTTDHATKATPGEAPRRRRLPPEANIFIVLIGIALFFEIVGWLVVGQSFLFNTQRLTVMILQVAVIGIIARSAFKLTRLTLGSSVLLWTIGAVMAVSARRWVRTPPMACRPTLLGIRRSVPSGMNMFTSPCHNEMLWWQPLAETPMNGLGMKQGNSPDSRPTCRQILR